MYLVLVSFTYQVSFCRYLVTFSPLADNTEDPQAIIIWDLRTGYKKRGFHSESAAVWPIFRYWSCVFTGCGAS